MGNKCCSDRNKGASNSNSSAAAKEGTQDPKGPALAGSSSAKTERKSVYAGNAYGSNPQRARSVGYNSEGGDAEKFDKAFENTDLPMFVKLLSSQQPIEPFEDKMHPWADDPRTVGALAGTQLAILASVAEAEDNGMKDRIREAGAIPPLVDFLRSDQEDRVHTAVVALSFLTADNGSNTVAAYKAGAMQLLLKHVDSSIAGMRAAAATTLRNICLQDNAYRSEFMALGGIVGLVGQLSTPEDETLKLADVQLEAILNLQDLIELNEGEVIEEYAREAIKAGAEAKLQALTKSSDEEVCSSAEEVLALLALAKK